MNILLVYHQPTLAETICDLLSDGKQGCTALQTCRQDSAIETTLQLRPDLILTEICDPPDNVWRLIAEVAEVHPTRIIAIGRSDDAKVILRTLNEGAYKYLDVSDLKAELPRAIRQVRAEPALVSTRGTVISVLGASGGCGASTLAVNLAVSYANADRTACLIDLHFDGGDLPTLLKAHPQNTLADFCQHVDRMDATLFENCRTPVGKQLAFLAAPLDHREIPRITPRGIRKAVIWARSSYPYVIVDLQRSFQAHHAQALLQSDSIVLVVRPELASVRRAKLVLTYLSDLGIPSDRLRLVIGRTSRSDALKPRDIETALGHAAVRIIPETSKVVNRALSRGVPIVTDRPRCPLSLEYRRLASTLNGSTKSIQ